MERGYIKIKPLDGLFFGKGRPFQMGDDTWTEASLLPPPGVVWGALFSQLWYRDKNTSLDALKIGKIMLMGDNITHLYLPAPMDLFRSDHGTLLHHKFHWQDDWKYLQWNEGKNVLIKPETDESVEPMKEEFLPVSSLKTYAGADKTFQVKTIPVKELIKSEYKIGIGRDEIRKVAEESMLYTVSLAHLGEEFAFVVEADYPSKFPKEGILKLGGEGKLGQYQVFDQNSEFSKSLQKELTLLESEDEVGFFKLYLTTPASLDATGLPTFLSGKSFSVEAGVTERPYLSGGFDLKLGCPKPKEMLASAGSVYIIEYTEDTGVCSTNKAKKLLGHGSYDRGFNQFEIIPYYGNKE